MKASRPRLRRCRAVAGRSLVLLAIACSVACSGGGGGSDAASPVATSPPVPIPQPTPQPLPVPPDPAPQPEPQPQPDPQPETPVPVAPAVIPVARLDALRLLDQSTFGVTSKELARVEQLGIAGWLDEQFARSKTGYHGFTHLQTTAPADCVTVAAAPQSVSSLCARDHYTLFELQRQFFANAMSGEDQLRQRVAFALSQIFVVSGTKISHAAGMAGYQNLLLDHAFGNFRELLEAVALSPVMGVYLDMVNNAKANTASGTKPNENFARELLQLFTVGTVLLDPDGSPVMLDGESVPAYNQAVVQAYARVFTGWTYAAWPGAVSKWTNPSNLVAPMVAFDGEHDIAAKKILSDVTLPVRQGPAQDLDAALDVLAGHSNVGPFIGRRLIQHLVTSNPSPRYIERITRVFNDNGAGVRGDLQAVVRAILMDPEARGAGRPQFDYGRLKDPAALMTGYLRALGGQSDGVFLRAQAAVMGQNIFVAPSVFNYFSPDYRIPGSTLMGPEFTLYDGDRVLRRADFIYQMVYADGAPADPTVAGSTGTTLDVQSIAAASMSSNVLDVLDARLMRGSLSAPARQAITTAMDAYPAQDALNRARTALYLLGLAPQFQVQR